MNIRQFIALLERVQEEWGEHLKLHLPAEGYFNGVAFNAVHVKDGDHLVMGMPESGEPEEGTFRWNDDTHRLEQWEPPTTDGHWVGSRL